MAKRKARLAKERRQHERFASYNLIYLLDPQTGRPFETNATLVNISEGGLCFYCSRSMPANERMQLNIDIREFHSRVNAIGRVAWSQKSTEHVGSFFMGVEFVGIDEKERDVIRRLTKAGKAKK